MFVLTFTWLVVAAAILYMAVKISAIRSKRGAQKGRALLFVIIVGVLLALFIGASMFLALNSPVF